jgi:hypothetical protein
MNVSVDDATEAVTSLFTVVFAGTKVGETITTLDGRSPGGYESQDDVSLLDESDVFDVFDLLASWDGGPEPWELARVSEEPSCVRVLEIVDVLGGLLTKLLGPQASQLAALARKYEEIHFGTDEGFPDYRDYEEDAQAAVKNAEEAAEAALREASLDSFWAGLTNCQFGDEFLPLAARHLIREDTDWDQASYDRLTVGFRTNIGQLHPDDPAVVPNEQTSGR